MHLERAFKRLGREGCEKNKKSFFVVRKFIVSKKTP